MSDILGFHTHPHGCIFSGQHKTIFRASVVTLNMHIQRTVKKCWHTLDWRTSTRTSKWSVLFRGEIWRVKMQKGPDTIQGFFTDIKVDGFNMLFATSLRLAYNWYILRTSDGNGDELVNAAAYVMRVIWVLASTIDCWSGWSGKKSESAKWTRIVRFWGFSEKKSACVSENAFLIDISAQY